MYAGPCNVQGIVEQFVDWATEFCHELVYDGMMQDILWNVNPRLAQLTKGRLGIFRR